MMDCDWKSSGRAGARERGAWRAGARSGQERDRHWRADGAPRDGTKHGHVREVLGFQRGSWEKGEASNLSVSNMSSKSTWGQH